MIDKTSNIDLFLLGYGWHSMAISIYKKTRKEVVSPMDTSMLFVS